MRFEILSIVANYKNFIQLNLPVDSPSHKNAIYFLREISSHYASLHFPLYIILSQVKEALDLPLDCRKHAIQIMRNIMKKHHFDDRYENEEVSCRIHMLYLPFITILVEKSDVILDSIKNTTGPQSLADIEEQLMETGGVNTFNKKKWVSHYKSINSTISNDKSLTVEENNKLFTIKELRDIFMIFFQIIKTVDVNVLMDYLKSFSSYSYDKSKQARTENFSGMAGKKGVNDFVEAFLRLVKYCLFNQKFIKFIWSFSLQTA